MSRSPTARPSIILGARPNGSGKSSDGARTSRILNRAAWNAAWLLLAVLAAASCRPPAGIVSRTPRHPSAAVVFWELPAGLPWLPDAIAGSLRTRGVSVIATTTAADAGGGVPVDPASAQSAACRVAASAGAERAVLVRASRELTPTIEAVNTPPPQYDPGVVPTPWLGGAPTPMPEMRADGYSVAMLVPMRLFEVRGCVPVGEESIASASSHAAKPEVALDAARIELLRDLDRVIGSMPFGD